MPSAGRIPVAASSRRRRPSRKRRRSAGADRRAVSIEEDIRRPAERRAKKDHRLAHAKPVVERFFAWVDERFAAQGLLPSNPLTQALAYARDRRFGLEVFLTDPDVPIDTNHLERALRVIPMGRRNWMFCWTELGARQVGILQSLIVTCRLHLTSIPTTTSSMSCNASASTQRTVFTNSRPAAGSSSSRPIRYARHYTGRHRRRVRGTPQSYRLRCRGSDDGAKFRCLECRATIQRVAKEVEQPAETIRGHRYLQRPATVEDRQQPAQAGRAMQGDRPRPRFVEVAMHLEGIALAIEADIHCLMQRRQPAAKDVDDRPVHFLDHPQRRLFRY
jgi:hypothetical protein